MSISPSRAPLFAKISLSIGVVVVYLVGMQIVLSFRPAGAGAVDPGSAYQDIYRPSDDPVLRHELVPGANGLVNAHGYIGPDHPPGRSPDAYRILALGDSITMYLTAEGDNYLLRAQEELGGVEVLNFAVAGYDTEQAVRHLERDGLAYEPDLVVVGYCLNDSVDFVFSVNETTGRIAFDAHDYDPDQMFGFIQGMVASAAATATPEQFLETARANRQWTASMEALEQLAGLSREHGFGVVVVVFPILVDFTRYPFEPVHQAVAQRAQALGFEVIDLLPAFRAERADALATDVIHPNAAGHAIAARELAARLRQRGLTRREAR
jgi:lysophospholipase L1-like esterase